jgi:phosphoglycerate dehydrogenase-like enzyme
MAEAMKGVSVYPDRVIEYESAVTAGGGHLVPLGADTRGLVWSRHGAESDLAGITRDHPSLEWVQLPSAGVEKFVTAGALSNTSIISTSAKGIYAPPVAEHALALTLALLRQLHRRARATTWGEQAGTTLHGKSILILGAGGIGQEFIRLTHAFGVNIVVCRRTATTPVGSETVIDFNEFLSFLPAADILLIAAPLTDETRGSIDHRALSVMKKSAILVNVARGGIVVTDDLVKALMDETIAGAALDVTDPEPLPDGHPLWNSPRALITPHTADTVEMIIPLLAERIRSNVARFVSDQPLEGVVDLATGY